MAEASLFWLHCELMYYTVIVLLAVLWTNARKYNQSCNLNNQMLEHAGDYGQLGVNGSCACADSEQL